MTEPTGDKSPLLFTSNTAEKVPDSLHQIDWVRMVLIFAVCLPVVACVSFFFVKFVIALFAVITPFIAGLVIALLLDPLVDKLEARGIHRLLAVSIVFLIFLGGFISILSICVPVIVNEATSLASNISIYTAQAMSTFDAYLRQHNHTILWLHLPKKYNSGNLTAQLSAQLGSFMQRSFGEMAAVLVLSVTSLFELLITMIVGFYLLVDIDKMKARLSFLAPEKYRKKLAELGQDIGQVFADYLRGLLIVCLMYGVSTTVLLYALAYLPKFGNQGIGQYALLIGATAGVLYAIPYIGSLSIGLVTFLVALSTGGFGFAVIAVVATLILNQTFDNIIAPRIVGAGVGLNPVLVIFSLSLGGYLLGFWGLLFSVPVAGSIQVILFRLIPKLTKPTPPAFLVAHGVAPSDGGISKIARDAPTDVKEKQDDKKQAAQKKLDKDIAAENAESPQ
jgi:predicted PurR-regulated permease PerM